MVHLHPGNGELMVNGLEIATWQDMMHVLLTQSLHPEVGI